MFCEQHFIPDVSGLLLGIIVHLCVAIWPPKGPWFDSRLSQEIFQRAVSCSPHVALGFIQVLSLDR